MLILKLKINTFIIWYLYLLDLMHHACFNKRIYPYVQKCSRKFIGLNTQRLTWIMFYNRQTIFQQIWPVHIQICFVLFCFDFSECIKNKNFNHIQISDWTNDYFTNCRREIVCCYKKKREIDVSKYLVHTCNVATRQQTR